MATIKKTSKLGQTKVRQAFLSILPVILILLVIRGYPIVYTIVKSFTNWDGMYRSDFVFLDNYKNIFTSSVFKTVLENNLILLINVPIQVLLGLLTAVLLYERVLGWKFFRAIYYLPQILSAVVIGYLFRVVFSLDGPLNKTLMALGLEKQPFEWLGSRATILVVLIICFVWFSIGWQTIVILGGMSNLSPSVFEAARIDGANYWQRTFFITLPMLWKVIEYGVIMSLVWTFSGLFPFVYSISKGGPAYDSTTLDYMVYLKIFSANSNYGIACAYAVILLIIILLFTLVNMLFFHKKDDGVE